MMIPDDKIQMLPDIMLRQLSDDPADLSTIGDMTIPLSHHLIYFDDDWRFFRGFLAKLIGDNILANFLEDDSIPKDRVSDLMDSVKEFALSMLADNGNGTNGHANGYKEHALKFAKKYRSLLQSKVEIEIAERGIYYISRGTEETPIFLKRISENTPWFIDTDIAFRNPKHAKELVHRFTDLIAEGVDRHQITKLCFVEKRKGPIGTLLMLSQIVADLDIPAFVYRSPYMDDLSRIKGARPQAHDVVGIVYDAANSGNGLLEVVNYLKAGKNRTQCKVTFAAVVIDHQKEAVDVLREAGVELVSLIKEGEIERLNNHRDIPLEMGRRDTNRRIEKMPRELREETHFRLSNSQQKQAFIRELFSNGIPFASYYGGVYATSFADRRMLEIRGYRFETTAFVNLSSLSLEERNEYKRTSQDEWRSQRDEAIEELLRECDSNP